MTEREGFKQVQESLVRECDKAIDYYSQLNDPDSNVMARAWTTQRNAHIIHIKGVKAMTPVPFSPPELTSADVNAPSGLVDPFADNSDPVEVKNAKAKYSAMMGNVDTFFAGVK